MLLILVVAGLLSCKDDPILPLTLTLVTSVKAYDLDNNGNSSDIRVDFEVKDNLNVIEYRIMIVPSNKINSFNEGIALSISPASFLEVTPESFKVEHSIKRLPSGILDVNGAQIQSDREYVIVVFVFGTGNYQLSEFSRALRLRDQPIYSGWYTVGWEESCVNKEDGAMTSDTTPLDGRVFVEVGPKDVDNFNVYEGVGIQCPECPASETNQGGFTLTINTTTITQFDYTWLGRLCTPEMTFGGCTLGEPCIIDRTGTGVIVDELIFEIEYEGEDCIRTCEGTFTLIKQG